MRYCLLTVDFGGRLVICFGTVLRAVIPCEVSLLLKTKHIVLVNPDIFVGSHFISVNVFVSLFLCNYKFRRKNQNRTQYVSCVGYGVQVVHVYLF